MRNMTHKLAGDLHVLVHTAKPPTDEEWDQYLSEFRTVPPDRLRTLVFTDGGGPSTPQRQRLNSQLGGKATRAAVVSPSSLVRGIVTTLAWFNAEIKSFSPSQIYYALEHLNLSAEEVQKLRDMLPELVAHLDVQVLKAIPRF